MSYADFTFNNEVQREAMANFISCWNCGHIMTLGQRSAEDGQCPKCTAEIDMEDELVRVLGVVKNMLDNDGHDGRYDAHEFLKARDALRVLIPKNDA